MGSPMGYDKTQVWKGERGEEEQRGRENKSKKSSKYHLWSHLRHKAGLANKGWKSPWAARVFFYTNSIRNSAKLKNAWWLRPKRKQTNKRKTKKEKTCLQEGSNLRIIMAYSNTIAIQINPSCTCFHRYLEIYGTDSHLRKLSKYYSSSIHKWKSKSLLSTYSAFPHNPNFFRCSFEIWQEGVQ